MGRNKCVINLNNLKYNLNQIKENSKKRIMAVIKADAYGHGAVEVARTLNNMVDYLAVACLDEAKELRENGINLPILILGATNYSDFDLASKLNVAVTIHDFNQLSDIKLENMLKIHIKVNSGMNRIGFFNVDDIKKVVELIKSNNKLYLEGIFTHYATADCDNDFYIAQRNRFYEILGKIDYKFDYIHSSNSAASINFDENFTNMIRPGKILYGLQPNCNINFDIKPVLSLSSTVVEIKRVKANERVGYANHYIASEDVIVATIPIGYGDGWLRRNEIVPVYINSKKYQIIGRICMDMLMVKVDDTVNVGDVVELIGPNITASRIASLTDTISYEVVCCLSKRLKRNYIE